MPNALWSIAFGDYDFAIDRKTLRVRLADTKTGVVWADDILAGWIELEDRQTGAKARYDFSEARLVSLSEKSGPQGKRILFGLDLLGIPIDLYFTCVAREIQLTVEASRDTQAFDVTEICLLPGLVSVPDDGVSHLVFPHGEGALLFARNAPEEPRSLRIWDAVEGVTMPFVGAVRGSGDSRSALGLITDSAYGAFHLQKKEGAASLDTHYTRDPERRRLDIRLVVLPGGDFVSIARAYRDKIIGERGHITLRKKIRERPGAEKIIGAVFLGSLPSDTHTKLAAELPTALFLTDTAESSEQEPIDINLAGVPLGEYPTRWEDMENRLAAISRLRETQPLVGSSGGADWSAVALDYWTGLLFRDHWPEAISVPLYAVVYHDSVVAPAALRAQWTPRFLRGLLNLSPPCFRVTTNDLNQQRAEVYRIHAVLCPLHRLCFAAFLTAHRFLTPDFKVEEALYSNGARVVINQHTTDSYVTEEFVLPPLGFYVRHAQMEAHDALRIGGETFDARAYRITWASNDQPLVESASVVRQEFPV